MSGFGMPPTGPPPSPEYLAENYGPSLLAINCTLFGIAALTMILRIYVRVFILKMFGIDGTFFFSTSYSLDYLC